MQNFLHNFHEGGKYTAQTANHHIEIRRDEECTDQKDVSIPYLQTDYLNLEISSGSGRNNEKANIVHTKCRFCGGANHCAEFFSKYNKG